MPVAQHWTANKTDAFVYRIASDFIVQLEKKMDGQVNQSDLAKRLGVSKGRVSQVFNNPGNLTLKRMVEYSSVLGVKVSVVAYDDADPNNNNGPINSEIFAQCWQNCGKPSDFFSLQASPSTHEQGLYISGSSNGVLNSTVTGPGYYANSWGGSNSLGNVVITGTSTATLAYNDEGQKTTGANSQLEGEAVNA